MTLEIIMPRYDEPWIVAKPFFDMLCCQKGVDFNEIRVRIIHDGSQPFEEYLFTGMPFSVLQSSIEHGGVSAARNYGLYVADAKWVCFCDIDDTFSSIYSLKFVFDVLDTDQCDLLWNPFFVENIDKGHFILNANRKFNMVWVHNKYYRLDFLHDHGIRFNENLSFSEDSAFNAVVNLEIKEDRIGEIKSPFPLYVWCWRKNSATTNAANKIRNIIGQFDRNLYVLEQFRKRNHEDSDAMAVRTVADSYISLTRTDLTEPCESLEKRVIEFYLENKDAIARVPPRMLGRIMAASEKEAKENGFTNDSRPPIDVWLKGLEEKYVRDMD